VSEIWDSQEQWEAFGEQLMPLLNRLGIDPGQPEVCEVHNIERRKSRTLRRAPEQALEPPPQRQQGLGYRTIPQHPTPRLAGPLL
jgi:hypothetical protein